MNVPSPCVNLCRVDQEGLCLGCFRSLDEIARWSRMAESEKSSVIAALDERRENFAPARHREIA